MNAIVNPAILESSDVRNAAHGRWNWIFSGLAPELELALNKPGRHVACPIHGGHDGFRLFRDFEDTGGAVCNTCGAKPDGFAVLQWLKGWNFPTTLRAVHEALGGVVRVAAPVRKLVARPRGRTQEEKAGKPHARRTGCHRLWNSWNRKPDVHRGEQRGIRGCEPGIPEANRTVDPIPCRVPDSFVRTRILLKPFERTTRDSLTRPTTPAPRI